MLKNAEFRPHAKLLQKLIFSIILRKYLNASLFAKQDPLWKTASDSALFPLDLTIRQKP